MAAAHSCKLAPPLRGLSPSRLRKSDRHESPPHDVRMFPSARLPALRGSRALVGAVGAMGGAGWRAAAGGGGAGRAGPGLAALEPVERAEGPNRRAGGPRGPGQGPGRSVTRRGLGLRGTCCKVRSAAVPLFRGLIGPAAPWRQAWRCVAPPGRKAGITRRRIITRPGIARHSVTGVILAGGAGRGAATSPARLATVANASALAREAQSVQSPPPTRRHPAPGPHSSGKAPLCCYQHSGLAPRAGLACLAFGGGQGGPGRAGLLSPTGAGRQSAAQGHSPGISPRILLDG